MGMDKKNNQTHDHQHHKGMNSVDESQHNSSYIKSVRQDK